MKKKLIGIMLAASVLYLYQKNDKIKQEEVQEDKPCNDSGMKEDELVPNVFETTSEIE